MQADINKQHLKVIQQLNTANMFAIPQKFKTKRIWNWSQKSNDSIKKNKTIGALNKHYSMTIIYVWK